MEVTVKETDLLNLPDYVDKLMDDSGMKEAGFLKFYIHGSCGSSTPLKDFIYKFGNSFGPSLTKLHPIIFPHAKDIYGHVVIQNQYLSREVVAGFEKDMKNPASYSIASENCCIAAIRESGIDGLLKHFDCELRSHSKRPPQYRLHQNLVEFKKVADAQKSRLSKIRKELSSLTEYEQGQKLQKMLESSRMVLEVDQLVQQCPCLQCVYTDDLHTVQLSSDPDDDEIILNVDPVANAKYYNRGFLYATGINVESEERNLITPNFSLSYLNLITITSMLDGHFPGINSPYIYAGSVHSFSPLFIEDLSLFSINFLHHGYPKLWLTFTILKEVNHSGLCLGILGHKYHLVTPNWLKAHEIPFKVILQERGQGVIVTPNSATFCFDLGPNISEKVNFATVSWIPYGIVFPSCICRPGQVHADLGPIVHSYCPSMLSDYLERKIPKVPNDEEFYKCVVHPHFQEPSVQLMTARQIKRHIYDERLMAFGEYSRSLSEISATVRKMKKPSNRKIIACPLCETQYAGGHKMRLYGHIRETHKNLSSAEQNRLETILKRMFPERGKKLPKVNCETCGKDLAGFSSLKRHQTSRGCLGNNVKTGRLATLV